MIRNTILGHFGNRYKNTEYAALIYLLDEVVPLVFYFYPVIFRASNYEMYKTCLARVALVFIIHCRRHYDKATLAQISDILYHELVSPDLKDVTNAGLNVFTEKKVEVFHSVLRRYNVNTFRFTIQN